MKSQPEKLKIKEAGNVIDNPVNKQKILERLSAMSEDIMFVKKEIENGSNNEDDKEEKAKEFEEDLTKMKEEEMRR